MRAVDDYRTALLAHFGHAAGGSVLAPAPTARPAQQASQQVPVEAVSIPPSQNPQIAANPLGLSEEELGFVPRPNVPLSQSTSGLRDNFSWPHREMAELNRRYLAQPTALQSRAREYQRTQRLPESQIRHLDGVRVARPRKDRVRRRDEERRNEEIQRRLLENSQLAENERQAVVNLNAFKPVNPSCHNVTLPNLSNRSGYLEKTALILGVRKREVFKYLGLFVADYGGDERFSLEFDNVNNNEITIKFSGSKGTVIKRRFSRDSENNLCVYHAYFKAGTSGRRSGTNVLKNSMWLYKRLNVKKISLNANIDVGGYAWARFGFKPSNWSALANTLKAGVRNTHLPEEVQVSVIHAIDNGTADTVWRISDMEFNGSKIGKQLLMGTNWSGYFSLDDEQAMRRFATYVMR